MSDGFLDMVALDTVWIPNPGGKISLQRGRDHSGPNGEPPGSGKWKLRLPNGQIYTGPTISASALETASECLHKWALSRLDNYERPTNRNAEMGGERHEELERWLRCGVRPTTDGMAKVISHFPMPGQCESEGYFGFRVSWRETVVVFAGYIDARQSIAGRKFNVETLEETPSNSTILDLKTTGDFRWKKTPVMLRANLQAALHALGEMLRVEKAWL